MHNIAWSSSDNIPPYYHHSTDAVYRRRGGIHMSMNEMDLLASGVHVHTYTYIQDSRYNLDKTDHLSNMHH